MYEDKERGAESQADDTVENREASNRPTYRKPILRRYDQIEQVKPYGPSEMEAS